VQLITWALEDKKPILAICRGMQLLNVVCGGDLYQHIASELPEAEDHVESSSIKNMEHLAHDLNIERSSKLARILGLTKIQTNAHHHQAVNHIASNLKAVAWTSDGIVEALESKDATNYIIAIQSHPEALVRRAEKAWLNLFISFVQAASHIK
jgi:putative glutamine amidotransferase